jgi:hypothetical protein
MFINQKTGPVLWITVVCSESYMSMVRRPWLVSLQPHNVLGMRFTHVPSSDLGHLIDYSSLMLSSLVTRIYTRVPILKQINTLIFYLS